MRMCIMLDVMHYLSNFNILLCNNIVHICDYINKHVAEICYIVYIALSEYSACMCYIQLKYIAGHFAVI